MIVGVAGIPGAWSSDHLCASLCAEGVDSFVFSMAGVLHNLTSGAVELHGRDLRALDGVVVKKLGDQSSAWARLRLHALRALEQAGVRIFSPADVIDVAMDRYRMSMALQSAGLPIPETVAVEPGPGLEQAVECFGDCVVKPVYTSKGRGMLRRAAGQPADGAGLAEGRYLVQRFIDAPGRDIGATVIGGKFAGAFFRVASPGQWMTTTAQGGSYAPCDLSPAGVAIAERAAAAFGLDYTVVDLVEQDSAFLVYEVSAFGGFRGLLEAAGVDAAAAYATYIRGTLESR